VTLRRRLPFLLWAARDVLRRPRRNALLSLSLALLTVAAAVPLLLVEASRDTARLLLAAGPSLVVRRVSAGGWTPLPADEAVSHAERVVGVTQATPRIWGVARGPSGPVTVVGLVTDHSLAAAEDLRRLHPALSALPPGHAVVGPGLAGLAPAGRVVLRAARVREIAIAGTLDEELSMAAHDVIIVPADDARALLGIAPGAASDLAVTVFHDQEQEAITPDLAAAFPWPVQITTRTEMLGAYSGGATRRGSIAMVALVPALLALAFIVLGVWRAAADQRRELALLHALGWTTGDIVRLRVVAGLLVGVPAIAVGLAGAYQGVFGAGADWVGELLFGWTGPSVVLTLTPAGAVWVLLEVAAMVLLPYLVAVLFGALRAAPAESEAVPLLAAGG